MKYIVIVVLISLYHTSFGQLPFGEQLKSARFQIVKTTIEFLATDTGTFKNIRTTSCNSCRSYDHIEGFIKDNQLTGAASLVRIWKNAPLDSSYAHGMIELENFRQKVVEKIAGPSKQRRRELPGYNAYTKKLTGIISGVIANHKADNVASNVAADEVIADPVGTGSVSSGDAASPLAGTVPVAGRSSAGLQPYLSYGAAGLFALLAFYFFRRNLDLSEKNRLLEKMKVDLTEAQRASEERSRKFNVEILQLEDDLHEARKQYEILQEKYKREKDKKKTVTAAATTASVTPPVIPLASSARPDTQRPAVPQPQQKPPPVIRFARYADQGDGFSANELLEQDDTETIFEITIESPGAATFKVVDNESAQRYALSNVSYFLSKTCRYDSFPTDNNSIHTDIPGELKLQGNKWLIISPAKISFN